MFSSNSSWIPVHWRHNIDLTYRYCSIFYNQFREIWAMSRWLLKISSAGVQLLSVWKCFLIFRGKLLCFCGSCHWTPWQNQTMFFLHPSFRDLDKTSLCVLFFKLNSSSSLILSSQERCSSPVVISMALHSTISCTSMFLL